MSHYDYCSKCHRVVRVDELADVPLGGNGITPASWEAMCPACRGVEGRDEERAALRGASDEALERF